MLKTSPVPFTTAKKVYILQTPKSEIKFAQQHFSANIFKIKKFISLVIMLLSLCLKFIYAMIFE